MASARWMRNFASWTHGSAQFDEQLAEIKDLIIGRRNGSS
jgi:hypothetical protein